MPLNERSAAAYDKLQDLTDLYNDGQARLQELRVLSRALKTLAVHYCTLERVEEPMSVAIVAMMDALGVERNRLYQQALRMTNQMDALNHQIQNGVFNESN